MGAVETVLLSAVLSLCSGFVGAALAVRNANRLEKERRAFEINQEKLAVLRKLAGNRAAAATDPLQEHQTAFYEALNEIMVAFSGSEAVMKALDEFRLSQQDNKKDRLITLFKVMCKDVGVDLSAFNDDLFLSPFQPGRQGQDADQSGKPQ